jgi:hypothetical protein
MSIAIPASVLKPLAALAAKWAESALKRWLDKRRDRRKAEGKWGKPVAVALLVLGLAGCGTLNGWLDKATDAWIPEDDLPAATTNAPPDVPEGREIEEVSVAGDGLWKPDTHTYLLSATQRKAAPGPGWSANGQTIRPEHIGKAYIVNSGGGFRRWLLWPGNTRYAGRAVDGTTLVQAQEVTESNRFGAWCKLSRAYPESGDTIRVEDIYGQILCELPIPDREKRAGGRR